MSDTYAAVDDNADVAAAVDWQEQIDRWPTMLAYKATMDRLSNKAKPALDVGSGPGEDAALLGAVALDRSFAMSERAMANGAVPVIGDAHQLPVADNSQAVVRADRVLQHLDRPADALREMTRVLRPGGRFISADPDQQTLSITVPGVPDRVVSTVRRLRRDVGYRNGTLASRVPGLLDKLGVEQIEVSAFALVLTNPTLAFGIEGWVDRWRDRGDFTDADDEQWRRRLIETADQGFVFALTYLVTTGVKAA